MTSQVPDEAVEELRLMWLNLMPALMAEAGQGELRKDMRRDLVRLERLCPGISHAVADTLAPGTPERELFDQFLPERPPQGPGELS